MKRGMELIRKLILAVEQTTSGFAPSDLKVEGFSDEQIGYHAYLLVDSGLATGVDVTSTMSSSPEYAITRLTWAGHDFADACRDESIWRRAMATIKDKVSSVSFDVLQDLLVNLLKGAVGL